MNAQKKPKHCIPGIHCKVTNCIHNNHEGGCTAEEIAVGPMFASISADTLCQSYRKSHSPQMKDSSH